MRACRDSLILTNGVNTEADVYRSEQILGMWMDDDYKANLGNGLSLLILRTFTNATTPTGHKHNVCLYSKEMICYENQ